MIEQPKVYVLLQSLGMSALEQVYFRYGWRWSIGVWLLLAESDRYKNFILA